MSPDEGEKDSFASFLVSRRRALLATGGLSVGFTESLWGLREEVESLEAVFLIVWEPSAVESSRLVDISGCRVSGCFGRGIGDSISAEQYEGGPNDETDGILVVEEVSLEGSFACFKLEIKLWILFRLIWCSLSRVLTAMRQERKWERERQTCVSKFVEQSLSSFGRSFEEVFGCNMISPFVWGALLSIILVTWSEAILVWRVLGEGSSVERNDLLEELHDLSVVFFLSMKRFRKQIGHSTDIKPFIKEIFHQNQQSSLFDIRLEWWESLSLHGDDSTRGRSGAIHERPISAINSDSLPPSPSRAWVY
jgi:hypothetical protein